MTEDRKVIDAGTRERRARGIDQPEVIEVICTVCAFVILWTTDRALEGCPRCMGAMSRADEFFWARHFGNDWDK